VKVVHKYEIQSGVGEGIQLPQGARFLHVAGIDDKYWMWAEVNPAKPDVRAFIGVVITGVPLPDQAGLERQGVVAFYNGPVYIDTIIMPDSDGSPFVGHVYHFGFAERGQFS